MLSEKYFCFHLVTEFLSCLFNISITLLFSTMMDHCEVRQLHHVNQQNNTLHFPKQVARQQNIFIGSSHLVQINLVERLEHELPSETVLSEGSSFTTGVCPQLSSNIFLVPYTGTRLPRYRSKNDLKYGCWNNQPRIGILWRKTASVGQKPLKRTMNPYASKIMPKIGHPMTTKKKPRPKEIVPLKFWRFVKNCIVDFSPMVRVTPEKKSIFPIASSPLSKKKMIPRNEKNTPNPVNPSPIFFRSFISKETIFATTQEMPRFTACRIWRERSSIWRRRSSRT